MATDLSNLFSQRKTLNPLGAALWQSNPAPAPVAPQAPERPTGYGDRLQSKIDELSAKNTPQPLPTFDIPAPTAPRKIGAVAPNAVEDFTSALSKGDFTVSPATPAITDYSAPAEPSIIDTASASENAPDDLVQSYLNDESYDLDARKSLLNDINEGKVDPKEFENYLKSQGYQPNKPEEPGFWDNLDAKAKERFNKALDVAGSDQSRFSQVLQTGGQAAGFVGDIFGEALVSAYKTAGEPGKEKAKELLKTDAGQAALGAISKGVEAWNGFKAENPETAGDIEAVVNIGSLLPIGKGAKYVVEGAVEGAETVGKGIVKGAGKTAELAWKWAEGTTEFVANQITGLAPETRSVIKESPELFQAAKKGEITPAQVTEDYGSAVRKRMDELSETGKEYSALRKGESVADGSEVKGAYDEAVSDVDFNQLTKEDESAIRSAQEYVDRYASKKDVTDADLLSLRKQIDSTISWDKNFTSNGERIVKKIRANVDGLANERIPGLKDLDAKFAPEIKLLQKVSKDVFNADGSLKDNAISTIMNLTGKWKELKIQRFLDVVPGLEEKIRVLKAFEDVSQTAAQKVGQYVKGGLLGGALATANVPLAIAGFMVTNPHVAAFVLQKYGMAKKAIKSILEKSASKAKFEPEEAKSVIEAFDSVPKAEVEKELVRNPLPVRDFSRISVPNRKPPVSIKAEIEKSKDSFGKAGNAEKSEPLKPLSNDSKQPLRNDSSDIVGASIAKPADKTLKWGFLNRGGYAKLPGKADDATVKLAEEAKKYKSADEFVDKTINTYHWTSQSFNEFSSNALWKSTWTMAGKKWFWFTDDKNEASAYARMSGRSMGNNELVIEKQINALYNKMEVFEKKWQWDKVDEVTSEIEKLDAKMREKSPEIVMKVNIDKSNLYDYDATWKSMTQGKISEIIEKAKKEGKDGVKFKWISDNPEDAKISTTQYFIFDPRKIKTESQLRKIWNESKVLKPAIKK